MENDSIVIQGAVENAEIVEGRHACSCHSCGKHIDIVGGIVMSGSISILADNQKSMKCPFCGTETELTTGG